MRRVAIVVSLAFVITLATVVGQRMSAEAMAVVVGVVCGVAAGIPMSVLLLLVLTRRERQMEEHYGQGARYGAYPPVVVIQGGTPVPNSFLPPYYTTQGIIHEPSQREFRIVGGDEN